MLLVGSLSPIRVMIQILVNWLVAYLSHKFRLPGICDVILSDVTMDPVTKIQELVIQ